MIKRISNFKYWEIAVAGVLSCAAVLVVLHFFSDWAAHNWPSSGGVHLGYLIIAAASCWAVTGVFIEAAFYKQRVQLAVELLDDVMDDIAGYMELVEAKETDRG